MDTVKLQQQSQQSEPNCSFGESNYIRPKKKKYKKKIEHSDQNSEYQSTNC